jgi:hypothetical protein
LPPDDEPEPAAALVPLPDDDALLLDPLDPQAAIASTATAISSNAAADLTYLFT